MIYYFSRFFLQALFCSLCIFSLSIVQAKGVQSTSQTSLEAESDISESRLRSTQRISLFSPAALGLKENEWTRYQDLMRGPLGRWNPKMDPILALGIMAKTKAEQKRFAMLYAKQEHALTERTLAFEAVYRQEFARLFSESPMVRPEALQAYFKATGVNTTIIPLFSETHQPKFQTGDRILYFPTRANCKACSSTLTQLSAWAGDHERLFVDIYVVGAKNKKDVKAWAIQHEWQYWNFPADQLSLNPNDNFWQQLKDQSGGASRLYLQRGETIYRLEEKPW